MGVALLIIALSATHLFDLTAIRTFTDRFAHQADSLAPRAELLCVYWAAEALLLKVTPHQIQILRLWIALMTLAPVMVRLPKNRPLQEFLAIS